MYLTIEEDNLESNDSFTSVETIGKGKEADNPECRYTVRIKWYHQLSMDNIILVLDSSEENDSNKFVDSPTIEGPTMSRGGIVLHDCLAKVVPDLNAIASIGTSTKQNVDLIR